MNDYPIDPDYLDDDSEDAGEYLDEDDFDEDDDYQGTIIPRG